MDMGSGGDGGIQLVWLPAESEISEFYEPGTYAGGYGEFQKTVDGLVKSIQQGFFDSDDETKKEWPLVRSISESQDHTRKGFFPEFLFDTQIMVAGGAVATGFYKLLQLWVTYKNGRKIRVKLPSGLEIDTSQMTEGDFKKLFSGLYDVQQQITNPKIEEKVIEHAIEAGHEVVSQDDGAAERQTAIRLSTENITKNSRQD